MKRLVSFDWASLQHLGILGIAGYFWHPELKLFFLFYLIGFYGLFKEAKKELDGKSPNRYYTTLMLSQLNPLTLGRAAMQLFGQTILLFKHLKGLPNAETYQNEGRYILPFEGCWTVAGGGSRRENSHSWDILTQRYAYDFLIADERGNTHRNQGTQLSDYYCFGQPVLSPADGTVVEVNNSTDDYAGVGDCSIDWKTNDFRGNYIIIRHTENEFSFIAHFKRGSILVAVGEEVKQGQTVGRCGNSGHSTEPHIHFHLQDGPNIWTAAGLPVRFSDFLVASAGGPAIFKANGFVEKNETVSNLPPAPAD